jgi:hypothetical protein
MFRNETEIYDFLLELNITDFCRFKSAYENGTLLKCINLICKETGLIIKEHENE